MLFLIVKIKMICTPLLDVIFSWFPNDTRFEIQSLNKYTFLLLFLAPGLSAIKGKPYSNRDWV